MDDHRFVFLAGLHRSGTTLLARLLAAHPEISGFSGTGVDADEGQHLQTVYPAAKVWGGPGRFGFAPEAHFTEAQASEEKARRLFDEWSPYWDLSRPVLLEKSPPNILKTRFLQALFPGSKFVVIIRHPIPVSIPTAKWRGTRRYDLMIKHWVRCHAILKEDCRYLDNCHILSYEQLVGDPESVLRGIFEFLELEPIAPSEPVLGGANEKYFKQWQDMKRSPGMRAFLDLTALRYERGVRRWCYSLRHLWW
jgi:hypothetical protein